MRLSVIIPTLNGARTIGGQLGALCWQEWREGWEVIVADNGSVDGTPAVVHGFQGKLPDLRIVDASERRGQPHTLNAGARHATGDAFLFIDDDDEVAERWLMVMGQALSRHRFVAARIDPYKLNPPWLQESRGRHQWDGLMDVPYPPQLYHAAGATLGVRRSVFEALGGFDDDLPALHDTFFCVRAQLAGIPLHFVPEGVVHMRFRRTLGDIYRQARTYGMHSTLMYRKMRELGTPPMPNPIRKGLGAWKELVRTLPTLVRRGPRAKWAFTFGYRMGRLTGSIKHRILAPCFMLTLEMSAGWSPFLALCG